MNTGLFSKGKLIVAALIAIVALITYYSKTEVNPITGEKQKVSLSQEQEVVLGLQSAPQMMEQFGGEVSDPKIREMVTRIGQKLVNGTEASKSKYKFNFHVLADPKTVNAFALPGGQIFITMVNGQWSMVNGQWSMVNGQWSMVNGQWSMVNGHSPFTIHHSPFTIHSTSNVILPFNLYSEIFPSFTTALRFLTLTDLIPLTDFDASATAF